MITDTQAPTAIIAPEEPRVHCVRERTVFGRLHPVVDGVIYEVEMHLTGLTIRRKWGRKATPISFVTLIDSIKGQLTLPL